MINSLTTDVAGGGETMTGAIDIAALARPNPEYAAPSQADLTDYWQAVYSEPAEPVSGVLGVINKQAHEPTALVSVDLCEVLRDTGREYQRTIGLRDVKLFPYMGQLAAGGLDIVTPTIQRLMNEGQVPVVDEIDEIAAIIRRVRSSGALVLANTSTLPGCEFATIDERFMASRLKDCFDGIVFPRNYDGLGTVTKADAVASALRQVGLDEQAAVIVHIDDTPHHLQSFATRFASTPNLGLFMPVHDSNDEPATAAWRVPSALVGFEEIEQYVQAHQHGNKE